MAVTTSSTLKLSDVCLELYGSSSTSGRSLMQCHTYADQLVNEPATGTNYLRGVFDTNYNTQGSSETLLDFRGYALGYVDIWGSTFSVGDSSGSFTKTVYSNTSWTISDNVSWCSVSPTSGTGNTTITITYTANTSSNARSGIITATAGNDTDTATINQDGVVADTQAPTPPSLTVGAVTETTIALSWSASADNVGIANYEVWYRPDNNANYTKFATLSGSTTSDTVTGLSAGTKYWFFIRALDAAGNYTDSKAGSGTTSSSVTAVSLASGSTTTAACTNLPITRYIDTSDFISATKLWSNSAGTTFAPSGWYSNGSQVRNWTGTSFTGSAQLCGF